MYIHAEAALLPKGWCKDLRLRIAGNVIAELHPDSPPQPGDIKVSALLPGLANLHSHGFQRGFSGLTEHRGPNRDSFWTWREMMYRFALALSPDEMQAIAAMAYVEMLEAGYTRVGEFHYLHHDRDGQPYADPAEMSARIFAAASQTGIALTHLPVFYAHGGFGPKPAGLGQRRFLQDIDSYLALVARCDTLARPQDRIGIAPHSLRAASLDEIAHLTAALPGRPVHIHIAEQTQEVEDCLAFAAARPVELLLGNAEVGPNWCLIHATHLSAAELQAFARSGAVAGLCPITEANLGDGIFQAEAFLAAGGRFGIGTDSNVEITARGELRLLEYSQRLQAQGRNICADQGATGARLFTLAQAGGAQALGAAAPAITLGAVADLIGLQDRFGLHQSDDRLLDRWIFGRDLQVGEVWADGAHLVQAGQHLARHAIAQSYAKTLRQILARM